MRSPSLKEVNPFFQTLVPCLFLFRDETTVSNGRSIGARDNL